MSFRTGSLTAVLVADVERSGHLWDAYPLEMRQALTLYDALIKETVEAHGGQIARGRGDGESLVAAFARAREAAAAGLALQRAAYALAWPTPEPFRIRVALHIGEPEDVDAQHFGPTVNRAARLRDIAHGGQVLLSDAMTPLVQGALPSGARLMNLGRHQLEALTDPVEVSQLAHPDLPQDFPPLRSLTATPNNLPQQLNRFVGRAEEVAELQRLIEDHRLVTLTGPGGTGKTRVALQAAAGLLSRFPDGIYLVELASATDGAEVPAEIARVVSIQTHSQGAVAADLADALADKSLLLILDNCEQVISAAADLAAGLLRYTRNVHILATSREMLATAGEVAWPLVPLGTPDPSRSISPEGLLSYEAVQLFVERARAVKPDFQLTARNAPAVAQICHQLDGIPLAIELAAARVSALPPENIAGRLHDRFRLLTTRNRSVLPRQQTLRALIDWSYGLLTEEERVAWRRLSTFTGVFSLEAAEAVIGGEALDPWDVVEYLTRLVEKSILTPVTAAVAGGAYYRMLETIRAYGAEKLQEAEEVDAVRRRMWTYYAGWAERYFDDESGDGGVEGDMVLQGDSLRASWSASLADGDAASATVLGAALGHYCFLAGAVAAGRRILAETVDLSDAARHPRWYSEALSMAGLLATFEGDGSAAHALMDRALQVAQNPSVPPGVKATVLFYCGQAWFDAPDRARDYFEANLELVQGTPDEVHGLTYVALTYALEGKTDEAHRWLDRAAEIPDAGPYGRAMEARLRAFLHAMAGDWDQSRAMALSAMEGFGQTHSLLNLLQAQTLLGLVEELAGRHREADRALQEALSTALDRNIELNLMWAALAGFFSLRAAHDLAAALWEAALARGPAWTALIRVPVLERAQQGLDQAALSRAQTLGRRLRSSEGARLALDTITQAAATPSVTAEGLRAVGPPVPAAGTPPVAPKLPESDAASRQDIALAAVQAMDRLSLRECTVIGNYRRYDERARQKLRDWRRRISDPLRTSTVTHENFLIWAAPGSGKSFLIQETARALGEQVSYFELNLARLGREDWVEGLRGVRDSSRAALVLLDEIDARADESWPYEEAFSLLDLNLGQNRQVVFVLIGSSPRGFDGMVEQMLQRSKGKDMLDRVPMDRRFQVGAPILEDKVVILVSQILDAAAARGQEIEEVEKLALYYALTDEALQTPRQLRDLAVAAVQRLPADEHRLTYDDLFYRGDKRNQAYWMSHVSAAEELAGLFVRVAE